MTVARLVRVAGRVQGVFFRAWTRSEAEALGVSGWVCNLADGSVEALIEGEPIAVETLVDRLRRGPPDAWSLACRLRNASRAPIGALSSGTTDREGPASGRRGFQRGARSL